MKYTVVWTQLADDALATTWMGAPSELRPVITQSVEEIERSLRIDPESIGESRDGAVRIVIKRPIVILYEVYSADRAVKVTDVRLVRQG